MNISILNNNVNYFNISLDMYTNGFQEHATINLLKPIEQQLRRQRLDSSLGLDAGELRKVIEHNASLRIDFGWSFESAEHLTTIMDKCVEEITPKYNPHVGRMVSDMRCSWLGFEPHNMYDKEVYKNLTIYGLIVFNNEIVDFQTEIVKSIASHPFYKQHAFLRDEWYRFETFKAIRKDRILLEEKYHFYMDAIKEISGIPSLPRDILENNIGMHFLYHPDLFFELLEFSILKGDIYE